MVTYGLNSFYRPFLGVLLCQELVDGQNSLSFFNTKANTARENWDKKVISYLLAKVYVQ